MVAPVNSTSYVSQQTAVQAPKPESQTKTEQPASVEKSEPKSEERVESPAKEATEALKTLAQQEQAQTPPPDNSIPANTGTNVEAALSAYAK